MINKKKIPVFPLNVVLFPEMPLPLHIFEERYRLMIQECLENDLAFGVVLQSAGDVHHVGCTAKITELLQEYKDGRMDILTTGVRRFVIESIFDEKPYLQARVGFFSDKAGTGISPQDELYARALGFLKKIMEALGQSPDEKVLRDLEPMQISFLIAAHGGFTVDEKQHLLELRDTEQRLKEELEIEQATMGRLKIHNRFTKTVHGNGPIGG